MGTTLQDVIPQALGELCDALVSRGRADDALKLRAAVIARSSFDEENEIGYVYFVRREPSPHFANLSTPVAETLSFFVKHDLNLDVDHDGDPFGLEFMGRPDIVAGLRSANEL